MANSPQEPAIKLLENVIECAICAEDLRDARVLPCFHTFCLKCIEKWSQNKTPGGKVSCPVCRKDFVISVGGAAALPKNGFVEKLLEVKKLSTSLSKGDTFCDVCCDDGKQSKEKVSQKATVYCVDCRRIMCDQCCGYHQKFRLQGEHKVIELNSEIDVDGLLQKFPENVCDKHTDKFIEIYCFDCKVAVCMMCCIMSHNSHKFSEMKAVAEDLKKQMSTNADGLATRVTQCKTVLKDIESNENKFISSVAETEKMICDRADKLAQLVEDYKQSSLEKLSAGKDNQLKQTANVRDEIERHQIVMENFIRYSNEVKEKGTACDIAKLASELNARSEELQKFEIESDLSIDYNTTEVMFTAPDIDAELKTGFGKLAIDIHGYFKVSGKVVHTVPNTNGSVAGIAILRGQMYVFRRGTLTIEFYNPTTYQLQGNLSFSYVYCGHPRDQRFLQCQSCYPSYGSQPRSTAVCDVNNCLYFSDQHTHFIYKVIVDQNNLGTPSFWQVGSNPQGLSVTSSNTVLVALQDANALQEFSTDGSKIRQISLQTAGISSPVHVVQLSSDQYAVIHHGPTHQISVVKADGQLVHSYNGDAGNMSEPRGMAQGSRGRLFVADQNNNRVLVFNAKSLSAYPLGLPDDCKLNGPYSLNYDATNDRLYIGEWNEGRIICCQL